MRDVGRVLGMPFGDLDKIAKSIPAGPGVSRLAPGWPPDGSRQAYASAASQYLDCTVKIVQTRDCESSAPDSQHRYGLTVSRQYSQETVSVLK